jgi:hypothetical protein
MNVPRGTDVRAVALVSRLMESDLDFHTVLRSADHHRALTFYGVGEGRDAYGQLEIWWGIEIDAREWGIKSIDFHVKRLVLDISFDTFNDQGDAIGEPDQELHYEYPEKNEQLAIGPDVDAPTPDNVYRMSKPNWKVSWKVESSGQTYRPEAEVDFARHTIEITF